MAIVDFSSPPVFIFEFLRQSSSQGLMTSSVGGLPSGKGKAWQEIPTFVSRDASYVSSSHTCDSGRVATHCIEFKDDVCEFHPHKVLDAILLKHCHSGGHVDVYGALYDEEALVFAPVTQDSKPQ
jgi:hypothetical protein